LFTLPQRAWPRRIRLALIAVLCLAAVTILSLAPRLPLWPSYHIFADQRTLLGIPNSLNVLSNLPFFLVGVWGLVWLMSGTGRTSFLDRRERLPYLVFFAGVMFTGMGSFWYHLAPSNHRLPWDLLPMTCSFVALVVATYMERVNVRTGYFALVPMLLLGAATVMYWYVTAAAGHGDYKYYLILQFFSPVVLALLIGLFPPRYSGIGYLAFAFGLYVVAKVFESYDFAVYRDLGRMVSGHALKHVTAGVACYWILEMLRRRHPVLAKHAVGYPTPVFVNSNENAATEVAVTRRSD
jgi:hypothetical protein